MSTENFVSLMLIITGVCCWFLNFLCWSISRENKVLRRLTSLQSEKLQLLESKQAEQAEQAKSLLQGIADPPQPDSQLVLSQGQTNPSSSKIEILDFGLKTQDKEK